MDKFINAVNDTYSLCYGYTLNDCAKITRKTANEMAKAISEASPKKSGEYAKNWSVAGRANGKVFRQYSSKMISDLGLNTQYIKDQVNLEFVVYNEKRYMLAHLLEYDHLAGKDLHTVKGHPHIAPMEEKYTKLFIERIEDAFNLYGG